jgi:nucleoside triphosphate pyrophosphatase
MGYKLPLILASSSPRRAELLRAAGIAFTVRAADVDEARQDGELPGEYVKRLAVAKASAIAGLEPLQTLILGADTTVVVAGEIIGKPRDTDDSARMLNLLSGGWHEVLTGVALILGDQTRVELVTTRVRFAELTPDEIAWYAASGESDDKAGAYAIQGSGSMFVELIEGSYSNVVGLPMETVYRMATEMGVNLLN